MLAHGCARHDVDTDTGVADEQMTMHVGVVVEEKLDLIPLAGLPRQADRGVMEPLVVESLVGTRGVGTRVRVEVFVEGDVGIGYLSRVAPEEPELVAHDRTTDTGVDRPELLQPVGLWEPGRSQFRCDVVRLESL